MKQPLDSAKGVAQATTGAITKTANFIGSNILEISRGVFNPRQSSTEPQLAAEPGSAPGIEQYLKKEDPLKPILVTVIDYGEFGHKTETFEQIESALAHPLPEQKHVRWINIDGLRPSTIDSVGKHFGLHTLSAEDVLNTHQRPKIEPFDDHLFIIVRQLQLVQDALKNEQVSFFLFSDTLISFQEESGDVFGTVRKRLQNKGGRFHSYKADYLFYALLDSMIDHIFPILEAYGSALEELEIEILKDPSPKSQQTLFSLKRDLSLLRRALWPIREVVDSIYREESALINEDLKTFFRDIQDHSMQLIDLLETYRDTASGLSDLYQSSVGNKMNEIMKVLTIMASFFIPITFLAGVYGMNFEYIPELGWKYAYPTFWALCLSATLGLAVFFWRKGWIGR